MKSFYLLLTAIIIQTLGYSQINLVPPSNFEATVNGNDVQLQWSEPDTANNFFLSWDNGDIGNLIGLTDAGSYAIAARWDSTTLIDYADYTVSKIGYFIIGDNSSFTSFIWQGPNADSTIFSQPINQVSLNDWTYIVPSNPVSFDIFQDLWVGYEVNQVAPAFPVFTDSGPAVQGFGDMVNFEGDWISMAQLLGFDNNFKIRVYLNSEEGESIVLNNNPAVSDFNFINEAEFTSQPASIQIETGNFKIIIKTK
jgi:hypothetical protein